MFPAAKHRPSGPATKRPGRQIALLLITAMVSFALGMTIGRNTAPVPQVVKVKVPVNRSEGGQDKLTFYNTLPRGETPALGSGVNRPVQPPPQVETTPAPATAATPPPAAASASLTPEKRPAAATPPPASVGTMAQNSKAATTTEKARATGWILQTASFPKESDAQTLGKKLQAKGYKARIEATEIKGKTWYRVYVGPYTAESAARQAAEKLDKERLSAIVRKL